MGTIGWVEEKYWAGIDGDIEKQGIVIAWEKRSRRIKVITVRVKVWAERKHGKARGSEHSIGVKRE